MQKAREQKPNNNPYPSGVPLKKGSYIINSTHQKKSKFQEARKRKHHSLDNDLESLLISAFVHIKVGLPRTEPPSLNRAHFFIAE